MSTYLPFASGAFGETTCRVRVRREELGDFRVTTEVEDVRGERRVLEVGLGVGEEDVEGFVRGCVEDEEGEAEEGWEGVACMSILIRWMRLRYKNATMTKSYAPVIPMCLMRPSVCIFCNSAMALRNIRSPSPQILPT